VPPLPTPGVAIHRERLGLLESVKDSLCRGAAAKPDFRITSSNAPRLARTLHRLEGIPLGLTGRARALV